MSTHIGNNVVDYVCQYIQISLIVTIKESTSEVASLVGIIKTDV